ncbi:unnamed protein product [Cyclocybe aegerita]|uniref:Lysine-specific metallo-endopeptidase domain-containing protein n=1 Tax=Cyclocybe aegerita TaxID=1973307 RepID=A0A8S0XQ33_CYCAE|nr:unnamed protein product [Cyclocybe aegerita]
MHFLSVRFIAALFVIEAAIAVPLGIEYDKTENLDAEETANKGRLDAATTLADAQVAKMREGVDKYKAGDAKAKVLFEAAYGKNANVDEVDRTVTALQNGNLQAQLATHTKFKHGEIAAVEWIKPNDKSPWRFKPANTHVESIVAGTGDDALNDVGRAGTVIHEATHQLSKTGDKVNMRNNIIRPSDGRSVWNGETGYTSNHNMHKTVAEVNADEGFTAVRDKANNMHYNAESHALFASLCSQPGALRRRDVSLYNRALSEGDHKKLHYLARRNSCKLPPDYFAKKAAAAKAAPKRVNNSKVAAKGGHRPSTKGGMSPARSSVKAPSAAKGLGPKAAKKSANGRRLVKSTTSAKKQATRGAARTTVGSAKTSTAYRSKAAQRQSIKRTARGSKSSQAHSSSKTSPRRGSPKFAASQGAKRTVHKQVSKRPSRPVKPKPAKGAVTAKAKKH